MRKKSEGEKDEKRMEERKETKKIKYKEIKNERTCLVGPFVFSTLQNRNIPVFRGSDISQ